MQAFTLFASEFNSMSSSSILYMWSLLYRCVFVVVDNVRNSKLDDIKFSGRNDLALTSVLFPWILNIFISGPTGTHQAAVGQLRYGAAHAAEHCRQSASGALKIANFAVLVMFSCREIFWSLEQYYGILSNRTPGVVLIERVRHGQLFVGGGGGAKA